MYHKSTVDLTLGNHYESNVIKASTTITTIHFALRVVSAEFHTNRSEARHYWTWRKQTLLDSYQYNLPNSAKDCLQYHKNWRDKIFKIKNLWETWYIRNNGVMQKCVILYWLVGAFANLREVTFGFVLYVCPSVRSSTWNKLAYIRQNFWKLMLEYFWNIDWGNSNSIQICL